MRATLAESFFRIVAQLVGAVGCLHQLNPLIIVSTIHFPRFVCLHFRVHTWRHDKKQALVGVLLTSCITLQTTTLSVSCHAILTTSLHHYWCCPHSGSEEATEPRVFGAVQLAMRNLCASLDLKVAS